jgi:hypothetical protein
MGAENIRYVLHSAIDKKKWDGCIEASPNGLVYALSAYLDAMAPGWDALVMNDYEAVFPLPKRKKFGLNYIFQPTLIAQLGAIGNELNSVVLTDFFNTIPGKFRYIDLPLNFLNNFGPHRFTFLRKNFVLDINKEYDNIYEGYNKNVKRNILKATRQDCSVENNIDIGSVTSLAEKHIKDVKGLRAFETVFRFFKAKGEGKVYCVRSKTGEILAAAAFLFFKNRAYYILAGNEDHSRLTGASHFLVDHFIRDHANRNFLLDFEGSDSPGVAAFYASFGATDQPYTALRWNRLPFILKMLKK